MSVKIHSLRNVTPKTIGMRDKFFLMKSHENQENEEVPYAGAISSFTKISEARTVSKKMRILLDSSRAILRSVDEYYRPELKLNRVESDDEDNLITKEDESFAMGAEDKFPIVIFCLLKAGIPHLHSEVSFMREFCYSSIFTAEYQYRLVELEQAICYIESLDWNVLDEEGVLISISLLEKRVLESVRTGRSRYYREMKEVPRVLWLAEILLVVGTRQNDKQDYLILNGRYYTEYCKYDYYFKFGAAVLESVGLKLILNKDNGELRLYFQHNYPQYVYSQLATFIEKEVSLRTIFK